MTIDELLAAAGLTANDEIPIWDAEATGEPTKKITAQNLANAVKSLASLIGTADIANNLTTTEAGKVLDARQGAILPCLVLNCGTISSVPTTISNAAITSDMVAVGADYGTPGSVLRATTANGSVTIYAPSGGGLAESTTLTLYLMKSRS